MRPERIRQGESKASRAGRESADTPGRCPEWTWRRSCSRPAASTPTTWRSSARAGRRLPPRSLLAARTGGWSWWSAAGSVGPASTPDACRPRRYWPPPRPATSLPKPASGSLASAALLVGKQALVEQLQAHKYIDLAAAYGWEVVAGQARFIPDPGDGGGPALQVDQVDGGTRRIQAAYYLVATGSAPLAPPIPGLEEIGYLTSTTAMELPELPGSLLVVGGNAVGLEQAQLFARLGTSVTVVELLDRLAPLEEPEAGAAIAGVFADEGITVHAGAQVARVARDGEGDVVATVRHHDGSTVELRAEGLLVAAGRRPVTDGLGLEAVGVKVGERGQVVVDERLRTHNPRIWAAGDVTGAPQFV